MREIQMKPRNSQVREAIIREDARRNLPQGGVFVVLSYLIFPHPPSHLPLLLTFFHSFTFFHASHLLEPGTGKYLAATGTAMVLTGSAPMNQSGTAED